MPDSLPVDPVAETKEFLARMDRQRSFIWKYREFQEKITHYFLYRLNGDRQAAEDLSSELFLKTYQRFASYDDRYAFSTWVYAIARNMLIDYLRSRAHRATVSLDDAVHISIDEGNFFDAMDSASEQKALEQAIRRLPQLQKEAVYRKHILLQSTAEIAQALGKSDVAVRQLISRGCRALRDIMTAASSPDQRA